MNKDVFIEDQVNDGEVLTRRSSDGVSELKAFRFANHVDLKCDLEYFSCCLKALFKVLVRLLKELALFLVADLHHVGVIERSNQQILELEVTQYFVKDALLLLFFHHFD